MYAVWFCSGTPDPMPCALSSPTAPATRRRSPSPSTTTQHGRMSASVPSKSAAVDRAAHRCGRLRLGDQRHRQERRTLLADIFGAKAMRRDRLRHELTHPDREAAQAANIAAKARREAARLRELPLRQAAARSGKTGAPRARSPRTQTQRHRPRAHQPAPDRTEPVTSFPQILRFAP